ncbi:MAG: hypothetical protein MZV64_17285 [Ignavibacteriales bacterium]|nr:hypothetical protein [Ignavibacteriales bacterium]
MIRGFQFAVGLEQADQNIVGEGMDLRVHLGGTFGGNVRFAIDLDDRLDQRIAEEQERLRRIHVTQVVAAGARGIFIPDGIRLGLGFLAIGRNIASSNPGTASGRSCGTGCGHRRRVFDTRTQLRDALGDLHADILHDLVHHPLGFDRFTPGL